MTTATNWRNRIVGSGEEDPAHLVANPRNFHIHHGAQQRAVKGSLDTLGWVQRVTVNRRTGYILNGHLRVMLALREQERTGQPVPVPVDYVDLSDAEDAQALASIDPMSALAGRDDALLNDLLAEIATDHPDVQAFLDGLIAASPGRADLLVDHTRAFQIEEGDEDLAERRTADSIADRYLEGTVRQIVLIMDVARYEALMPRLAAAMAREGCRTTTDLAERLLDLYEEAHP